MAEKAAAGHRRHELGSDRDLVLVGIVLAIPLGIALRVRSRNRRAMVEYVASR